MDVLPAAKPVLESASVRVTPPCERWPDSLRANAAAAHEWDFRVAGQPADKFRDAVRAEAVAACDAYARQHGLELRPAAPDAPVIVTGHQPDLYHPGIWVKNFLMEQAAVDIGAYAINLAVDTDAYQSVSFTVPCLDGEVRRCSEPLALGEQGVCFACAASPDTGSVESFIARASKLVNALDEPYAGSAFARFAQCLRVEASGAATLAELMTLARRRFEQPAGTGYAELPVTKLAETRSWMLFAAHIALDARRFAAALNAELADFRRTNKTRSPTEPFPDLAVDPDVVELPLWLLRDGRREPVHARILDGGVSLESGEFGLLLGVDPQSAAAALDDAGVVLAPKAVTLTLFARLFLADLFIHGLGGARYDAVTDGLCRRYFGIEPPAFVVATADLRLRFEADHIPEERIAAAKDRLNRLGHNPDVLLGEADFLDEVQAQRARDLVAEKRGLVARIAEPDADRKALGLRIKQVNAELAEMLAPLRERLAEEVASLERRSAAYEVLTDRVYPFCLWLPEDMAQLAARTYGTVRG